MAKNNKQKTPQQQLQEKPDDFLIVGIGASAGGIQALQEFFSYVPEDSGMAYVVILHLSPDHDSQLASVLQQTAKIPVAQVTEKVKFEPNNVYVVPPNRHLSMEDGYIIVSQNTQIEERRAPVDIFFRSLADAHGPRAISVILSGTGANGSMGLKRIKERGGATFVQNPREAEFNEMPRNAIATELVDQVLPVAEIPARIITFRNNIGVVEITPEEEKRPQDEQQALREIFTQLRVRTGQDFSNYKRPTLLRRIERRINIFNLPDLPAYTAFLQQNPHEANALLKDLLISVTNFFRDKKAFEVIEQEVIPILVKGKNSLSQLRIWVAGCATGEEAYSLAILFAEKLIGVIDAPKLQIFATDIDESAIVIAREGLYTINDLADVSPERLRRFFNKEGDSYRIRREIRETILFANHNFIKDPPFSHLNLISCRNVMIYLNNMAQERVVETFHFALNPGCFLFLGNSESVDGATDLFATYNREQHIFQSRQASQRTYPIPESVPTFQTEKQYKISSQQQEDKVLERISFADLHQQLLEQYAAPSLVINEDYDIIHLSERAGKYLQIGGGDISQNLLKLIKPELRLEMRSALYQATQRQAPVEAKGLKVNIEDKTETLNIHIRPVLRQGDNAKGFILVLFETTVAEPGKQEIILSSDELVARQLEEELIRLKTQLRSSNEQHEFQAEELKASNEELQAMNEELRSAAEELETSKEELQSINEELRTVNQELKVKIEETSLTNNNLQNLINSTNIATIFLDRSFKVSLFTPAIKDIFNLIPGDYGRPVTDITNRLNYDNLVQDVETVLDKLNVIEREITTTDKKVFLMRLAPYRTTEDRINGVVITFFDITERIKQEEKQQFLLRLSDAIRSLSDPLEIQSVITHTVMNRFNADRCYFCEFKGDMVIIQQDAAKPGLPSVATTYSIANMPLFKVSINTGKPIVVSDIAYTNLIDENLKQNCVQAGILSFINVPVIISGEVVGNLCITQSAKRLWTNEEINLAKEIAERTWAAVERGVAEQALRESEERLRLSVKTGNLFTWAVNPATGETKYSENADRVLGFHIEDTSQGNFLNIHPEDKAVVIDLLEKAMKGETSLDVEHRIINPETKEVIWVRAQGRLEKRKGDAPATFIGITQNITEQKIAEVTLQESEERLRVLIENLPGGAAFVVDKECRYMLAAGEALFNTGFKPEDYIGKTINEVINSEDASAYKLNFTKTLLGETFSLEHEIRGRSFLTRGVPLKNEKGEVYAALAVSYDITSRKKTEEALRESEARLKVTMEAAVDYAIITTNQNGDVEGWSKGAERIFGYSEEQMRGKSADIIFTPEDIAAKVPQKEMETARDKGIAADERWHQRKDGSRFFMSGTMRPINNPELMGYVKVARDMTEQKAEEEKMRISEERYRIALKSAEMAAWDWNVENNVVEWNDQHYYILGLQPGDVKKSADFFLQFVHADDLQRVKDELTQAVEETGIYHIEFRIIRKDGELRWMNGYGRAVNRSAGKAKRMVGVMFDITERKQLEQQKEDFISIASHELKTPLTSIKAYTEVLHEMFKESDDASAGLMEKLNMQVDRLISLIRDLLDTSKITEGQLTLNSEKFDLNKLIEERVGDLQRLSSAHRLIVSKAKETFVTADRERIGQVLTNLISNAVKYSPKGGNVIINCRQTNEGTEVSVRDEGIGISAEMQQKVFDRFFRANDVQISTYPGMGLGLYITANIIRRHGGKIWVESKPNEGSTFYFMLPGSE